MSYGAASPGAAVVEVLAGVALFVAATLVATDARRRLLAFSTFALGLAWTAALWAGWVNASAVVRSIAILLVPTVPVLALLVVSALLDRRGARVTAIALAVVTLAVDAALWLVRAPFLDRYCWRDCLAETGAPFVDVDGARTLTNVSLGLGIASGIAITGLARGARYRIFGSPRRRCRARRCRATRVPPRGVEPRTPARAGRGPGATPSRRAFCRPRSGAPRAFRRARSRRATPAGGA